MRQQFKDYLKFIGLNETIQSRVENIYEFYEKRALEEIKDIFITEYLLEDGTRRYENLWFFSESYVMEAKQFLSTDDFDFTPVKSRIFYIQIKKQDYDFEKSIDKSRLSLHFAIDTGIEGDLKASKENCDYLRDIASKYMFPNLKA